MSDVSFERPELFKASKLKPRTKGLSKALLKAGRSALEPSYEPNIAILIRTKNDEAGLARMLNYLIRLRKNYAGRIDVVIVDTESSDDTLKIANAFGAKIVPIKQVDFSYPKGINIGLHEVAHDTEVAFITVGHALPALSNCLQAGLRHFSDPKIVGAYGAVIPNDNATFWESFFFSKKSRIAALSHKLPNARMGAMGATNCLVRMSAWRKHPFDEAYAGGGEDTAWAAEMLSLGKDIVFEPALAVHHTHGLSLVNILKQRKHWGEVAKKATQFDTRKISARRPDLFKK